MKWIAFILGAVLGSAAAVMAALAFFVMIPKAEMVGYMATIDGITYQWRPIRGPKIGYWMTPDSVMKARYNIPPALCMKQFLFVDTGGRQIYIKPRGIEVIINDGRRKK